MEDSLSNLAQKALDEYNSAITTAHHGGAAGRPFWNVYATQFMYNPCFQFPFAPGCNRYLFTAVDCNQEKYTFEADAPTALLTPIWGEIPEGFVKLTVEALDDNGTPWTMVGARTFFRCAPFAGPENYPPKAREYRECALMAYRYVFSLPFIQHWRKFGTPDPEFDFNVYPSKTISSVIRGMIQYAQLEPENAREAMEIATSAADFLISITFPESSPLAGLPPTYYVDFRKNLGAYNNEAAIIRGGNLMMLYPAEVGSAYLMLEKATGEPRYYEAARKIADYYRTHVQPNGSWYLFLSVKTGENQVPNYCIPDDIMSFMHEMFLRTGETVWAELEQGCYDYLIKNCLETYNWEGQFEDSKFSVHYSNLSHHPAGRMLKYIVANKADDAGMVAEAEDLMRFIEDQFVVWGNFAPWNYHRNPKQGGDISQWFFPAGLEQYHWYMPIDASTSDIMDDFLHLYSIKKDPLLFAKACVLGDMITRMQNPKTGLIPTHWMRKTCIEDGGNLWINCMLATAKAMLNLAQVSECVEAAKNNEF